VIVRTITSIVVSVVAIAAVRPATVNAQVAGDNRRDDLAAVAALKRTLADVIASAERSVVAIARFAAAPPADERRLDDVFAPLRQTGPAETPAVAVGCGVIIDPAGLVLTEYLAVREGDRHTVTTVDGTRYAATIRAADPKSGLAVLATDVNSAISLPRTGGTAGEREANPESRERTPFAAIRFGDAGQLRKGNFVIAIGNPYAIQTDGQPTASWGIVANLARKAPAGANLNDVVGPGPPADFRTTLHHLGTLIQTDAKLGWSSGGGALVNLRGELVGLTTTIATIAGHERPAGYAIPVNAPFLRIIDALKEGREVEYGLLGVSFSAPLSGVAHGSNPLAIAHVYPGSPAYRADLEAGDVITDVDGRRVSDVDDVQLAVSLLPPASVATIGFTRGGRQRTAEVRLAKLAVAGKRIVTNRPPAWRGIRVDYATALDATALAEATASGVLDAEGCVLVAEVEEDSVAWKAGMRSGMFISHVGAERVSTPDEFRAAVQGIGDTLDIRFTQPLAPQTDDAEESDQ